MACKAASLAGWGMGQAPRSIGTTIVIFNLFTIAPKSSLKNEQKPPINKLEPTPLIQ